jgi:YVTN family beta-propeller protein
MRAIFLALVLCLALLPVGVLLAEDNLSAVLPNGREIHPVGSWVPLAPYPFALAVRPDGRQIVIPSIGFPFALNVIADPAGTAPRVRRMPAESHVAPGTKKHDSENDPAIEVHAGLAYSPDGALLYVATGDSGKIRAYRTGDWDPAGEVSLDGPLAGKIWQRSFAATVAVSADGRTLYALDQGNWRIVIIDARTLTRLSQVPTGAYPFGLAFSPDGTKLYVTNTGLFEYSTVPGYDEDDKLNTGLRFPPFGYPSKAARKGVTVEGKRIPALGNENSVRGSSLWTYSVSDRKHPSVTAKLRLGATIQENGGRVVGGAAPTGVVAADDAVYVALAHEDEVVKVSTDGSRLLSRRNLSPFADSRFHRRPDQPLRGVVPSGMALRENRLYVAESGINAVGVLDLATLQVIEQIPVGWNPSALAFSPDGEILYVVNTKGKGAGPNGGKNHDPDLPSYIGSLEFGSLSIIPIDSLPPADSLSATVIATNTAAITGIPSLPHLQHCFLVIRENRTYDEVLGDVARANGDPSLARYGMDGWAEENNAATHLHVTPNLHALIEQFAMSDNYFVDGDVSNDGHRFLMGMIPTPFFNTAWTSGYGGRRKHSALATQPGRKAMFGGADSPMPEDEPEFGSLWEHVAASGKGILNYGEGLELEGNKEIPGAMPEGQRLSLNSPLPQPVFEETDRNFPTFNLGIPDQLRVDEFARNLQVRIDQGKVPALIVIRLPNDHTTKPRPADGYPYRASYVADNDLATGRIIAYLSKTSIWKDSAVFVTEDDAQSGVDHVDAHRSILLVASPWVIPGALSHQHTSMGSIIRTIDELLGLEPLNLEDALAAQITGVFDTTLHLEPFTVRPSDTNVFDPAKAQLAKPLTKAEADALHNVDDADEIRKEITTSKSKGTLSKPNHDQ